MVGCEDCRLALSRCRDLYFQVDRMIPQIREPEVDELQGIYERMRRQLRPSEINGADAFRLFLSRKENLALISGVLLLIVWQFVKRFFSA